MSLLCHYTLKCDMCGATKYLGDNKSGANEWARRFPVIRDSGVLFEPLDLCPSCYVSLALHPVEVNGETHYARKEDEC